MTPDEHRRLEMLAEQQMHENAMEHTYDNNSIMGLENVLSGAHSIDISHVGGKFGDLTQGIYGEVWTL
jgi:hypothetical protein